MRVPFTRPSSRRDLLAWGGLSALGLPLVGPVSPMLGAEVPVRRRAKSCILIWLDGGPSHLETWDLKPEAPVEVRGPFGSIETAVPGLRIGELLPETARIARHLAVVRSVTSPLGEHGLANHYLLTGYKPSAALTYPSFGSVVARLQPNRSTLPPYVAVPDYRPTAGAGFLGSAWQPFATGGDPGRDDFRVRDLDFFPGVTLDRIERRRDFLHALDGMQRAADAELANAPPPADAGFEQAYRLATSPDAKQAFDLQRESPELRARYGPRTIGQSCLLARRLVERGVPFVTVLNAGWDTHEDLVLQLKDGYSGAKVGVGLIPSFDLAFAALIQDLDHRGMLDETLVVAMGEFGRTPKLNARGGRDHWPRVFSVVLAGGGVRGGQVIGASDAVGESPADRPVTPADLARTIYTLLGVDPDRELQTSDGRPIAVNQGGRTIAELLA